MNACLANERFPYFGDEHDDAPPHAAALDRRQGDARADAWEEQGYVPREVLREMGSLGLLGMRYAPEHGGAGLDTLANAVLAEGLGAPPTAASP